MNSKIIATLLTILVSLSTFIATASEPSPSKTSNEPIVARKINAHGKLENISVAIDSIMSRDDVSRVYATLHGPTNHSGRIDSAQAIIGTKSIEATDIDGVDFNRWFQWDDTATIVLEIDFPASTKLAQRKNWTLRIVTNRGILTTVVTNKKK